MLKNLVIFIALSLTAIHAIATVPYVSHEDYVHWSDADKERYHIQIMELVVRIESQYAHETAQNGFNEERYRQYVQIIETIKSNFFIPDAIAAASRNKSKNITWNQIAESFGVLSKKDIRNPKDNILGTCLYAGWVSRASMKDGWVVCTHPDFIDGSKPDRKVTLEGKNYPFAKAGTLCDQQKDNREYVQCNPVIFGYKKASEKTLFCVKSDEKAENAAFKCMQEALKESGSADADSKQERMDDLKKRYSENKNAFESVFKFSYKTCVCSVPTNKLFHKDYQDYMRPGSREMSDTDRYRTCFGLMRMMNEIQNACSLPIDNGIFKNFEDFLKSKKTDISGEEADKFYDEFIRKSIKQNPQATTAYNAACNESLEVKTPETKKPETTKPETTKPAEEKPQQAEKKEEKKEYSCTAKCNDAPAVPEATEAEQPKYSCDYEVAEKADSSKKLTGAQPDKLPESREAKTFKVKHASLPAEGLDCAITWEEKKPETTPDTSSEVTPTLKVTITDKGEKAYKIKAETDKDAGWTFSWDIEKVAEDKTKEEKPKDEKPPGIAGEIEKPEPEATPAGNNDKEITRKRFSKSYKVCGVLKSQGKQDKKECVSVDALGKKQTSSGFRGPPGGMTQPPVQMRGASDTSAVGIR